jgi:hypothetical protein
MAFELKSVVPWGRNLDEYQLMFNLSEKDLTKKIISVGDGPASFNTEMKNLGYQVTSLDPIYAFSKQALTQRIEETKQEVLTQMRNNQANFVWNQIKDIAHLDQIRMQAMHSFLADFEDGKQQGRYVTHAFPAKTHYQDQAFDLGLSSHFLVLYANLGLDFHLQAIAEMLRICKEVRIFPLLDLNAQESGVLRGIMNHFQKEYQLTILQVAYEFQIDGNKMLIIKKLK